MKAISQSTNRALARLNLITSLGDFVSLFAILVLLKNQTGNIELAAYSIPLRSLGVAAGGALFPYVMSRFSLRALLTGTQIMSGVFIATIAMLSLRPGSHWPIYMLLVAHSILKQIFDGARETYSKFLAAEGEHRTFQAELLHSLYGAQIIGPLLSLVLLRSLGAIIPLWIDALSFGITAWLCWKLPTGNSLQSYSILRPITYLGKNHGLLQILLLRSVGYWLPVGLFNYLLFTVAAERYGVSPQNMPWTYVAIGLGSVISSQFLRANRGYIARIKDATIASLALSFLAFARLAFLIVPSFGWALLVLALGGISNGANAVTTQSLRRKLATDDQFPEIVGLELVLGRITEWIAGTFMFTAMTRAGVGYGPGIVISAVLLVGLAMLHRTKALVAA